MNDLPVKMLRVCAASAGAFGSGAKAGEQTKLGHARRSARLQQ